MNVRLSKEQKVRILNGADLYAIMQQVLLRQHRIDRTKEHMWVVGLSRNNTILNIELVSLGSARATVVDPADIFSIALQKRSSKIVLVHNHPGGSLQPSAEDVDLADLLTAAGTIVGVEVYDHMIITTESYYSFIDSGMMDLILKSKRYALPFKKAKPKGKGA